MSSTNGKPPWRKEKIWMAVLGTAAVLAVFLAGAPLGLTAMEKLEAVNAIKWIVGFLIGGHALSDAAHSIASRPASSSSVVVNEPRGPAEENSTPAPST